MRISDWSSYVCSSDLAAHHFFAHPYGGARLAAAGAAFVEGFGEVRETLGLADDEAKERQDRRRGQLGQQEIAEYAEDVGHRFVERQVDRERVAILRSEEHTSELQSLMRT